MYSTADVSATPRPMYPADGRKVPDVYTAPSALRDELQAELGTFPLFEFWGPRASINSTRWIAAAAKRVEQRHNPTLTLVYLPHLDYNLQRVGIDTPAIAGDLTDADEVTVDLITFYEGRGARVLVLSEYGIVNVSKPVHINRVLRQQGLIAVRRELGRDVFDPGASAAFAVADHQVAHVYVADPRRTPEIAALLASTPGIDAVLDDTGQRDHRVRHGRSGDLIAVAAPDAWFTYYYWLDDRVAPDYARTVDIHRKPGYDPVELILDPKMTAPMLQVAWKLAQRKAGLPHAPGRHAARRHAGPRLTRTLRRVDRRRPVRDRPRRGSLPQRSHEFGGCVFVDFESGVSVNGLGSTGSKGSTGSTGAGSRVRQVRWFGVSPAATACSLDWT